MYGENGKVWRSRRCGEEENEQTQGLMKDSKYSISGCGGGGGDGSCGDGGGGGGWGCGDNLWPRDSVNAILWWKGRITLSDEEGKRRQGKSREGKG